MKKNLSKEIEITEGVTVKIENDLVQVKGKEGELSKNFNFGKLNVEVKEGKVVLGYPKSTKREKKMMNTLAAQIANMIRGVNKKFVYELKICFGHFPFTVKKENNFIIIKNFLGEKTVRKVQIPKEAQVEIGKDRITVKAIDKEIAGQASANFEVATTIKGRDKRIFQDGIYITSKDGKAI